MVSVYDISEKLTSFTVRSQGCSPVLVLALRQETPYAVHWVSDGFEALRAIGEDKPDLLILDYQLPRMNAIDLYDKIHALPGFEHIPGIMMSAQLPKREIEKRTLVGISKPFELGELFDALEQFLA
ncbi:MAG TPA: response regulator [Ktedonobacteraceae bacterium]